LLTFGLFPFKKLSYEKIVFLVSFFYVCFAALIIQFLVIPEFLSDYHWGSGLLKTTDALTYHLIASSFSEYMNEVGISVWEHSPNNLLGQCVETNCGIGGVRSPIVGLLSLFYYFFGIKPWTFIFFNALVHASSSYLIFKIFKFTRISPKIIFLAVLPFIFFPSSAEWWSQIGKDGIFILAILMFFYSILKINLNYKYHYFLVLILSFYLILTIRPYFLEFLFLYVFISIIIFNIPYKGIKSIFLTFIPLLILMPLSLDINYLTSDLKRDYSEELLNIDESRLHPEFKKISQKIKQRTQESSKKEKVQQEKVQQEKVQQIFFEKTFGKLIPIRNSFSKYKRDSDIDSDISINSFEELVDYIPRYTQVALFAPFPNMWFKEDLDKKSKIMRGVSGIEMLIYYFSLVVIFLSFFSILKNKIYLFILLPSFLSMFIFAFTNPNIGTIYRQRYSFFILIVCTGLLIFLNKFYDRKIKR